jgi:hypothetical protein
MAILQEKNKLWEFYGQQHSKMPMPFDVFISSQFDVKVALGQRTVSRLSSTTDIVNIGRLVKVNGVATVSTDVVSTDD